ncbi:hypothetical protein HRJ34_08600 [Rhizorhabdus wittichii]|uniref:Lipoprotein n=1 Tax=Rhizorhabdus wittichii TaxID=160791 RepID=A0A975D5Z7_9SPHN|nr:hypothetical protein [Rhizorhabdus wittichii]QTH23541.1 hypothetical protein HRJ34_08600 [Rhizorhabdus wittichii]
MGDIRPNKMAAVLLAFGLLVACKGKYADMSFEEIQAMARKLPLAERYDFYLEVRGNSRLPPNDQVKYDIVALGDPAWRYTIGRAMRNSGELSRALPVLSAFGRSCTKAEYRRLRDAVKRLTYDGTDDQRYMFSSVDTACGLTSPQRGPQKYEPLNAALDLQP